MEMMMTVYDERLANAMERSKFPLKANVTIEYVETDIGVAIHATREMGLLDLEAARVVVASDIENMRKDPLMLAEKEILDELLGFPS